jgi:hypothetical protein
MNISCFKLLFTSILFISIKSYGAQVGHVATNDQWKEFITAMHQRKTYKAADQIGFYAPLNGYWFLLQSTNFDKDGHLRSDLFLHGVYTRQDRGTPIKYEETSKEHLLAKARSLDVSSATFKSFEALLEVLQLNSKIFTARHNSPSNLDELCERREELQKQEFKEE